MGVEPDPRIYRPQPPERRRDLGRADISVLVQELALEVVQFNPVEIGDPQRADARGGEVERRGAAEAAGAHHQNSGRRKLALTFHANLCQRQMPAVPGAIGRGELGRRCHPRYARVMRARRK